MVEQLAIIEELPIRVVPVAKESVIGSAFLGDGPIGDLRNAARGARSAGERLPDRVEYLLVVLRSRAEGPMGEGNASACRRLQRLQGEESPGGRRVRASSDIDESLLSAATRTREPTEGDGPRRDGPLNLTVRAMEHGLRAIDALDGM